MALQRIRQVRATPPAFGGGGHGSTQVRVFDYDPDDPNDENRNYRPGPGDSVVGFEVQPQGWTEIKPIAPLQGGRL